MLAIWGCIPKVQTGVSQESYYENLSAYRPTYPAPAVDTISTKQVPDNPLINIVPKYDITDTLRTILDSTSVLSQKIRYVDGYTVQIYSGNSRKSANMANGKATALLNEGVLDSKLRSNVSYKAPNFKVQVGRFFNMLDAHAVHAQLLSDFPNSIIVLKKFRINRN